MSWDVWLLDDAHQGLGEWNYTHNVNPMIEAAMAEAHMPVPAEEHWYDRLHTAEGPLGAWMLHQVASELDRDPARYDAMNPPNGWGNREGLVVVLREMVRSVPERPCYWTACG